MKLEEIRPQLQRVLGNPPISFVKNLEDDFIDILEAKNTGKAGKLQKVTITDIPFDEDNRIFWLLDELESTTISGFSARDRTVDVALFSFTKKFKRDKEIKRLDVFLIELKGSIKNTTLTEIIEKFQCSMSRIYKLLCLNDNHTNADFKGTELRFKGIIFYTKNSITTLSNHDIEGALKNKKGACSCETILGSDKIPVYFLKTDTKEFHSVKFEELEK